VAGWRGDAEGLGGGGLDGRLYEKEVVGGVRKRTYHIDGMVC
jgi:hypothetical protein